MSEIFRKALCFQAIVFIIALASCSTITRDSGGIQAGSVQYLPQKTDYPHWNFQDTKTYDKLFRINNFIECYKNKGYIAVFDWDGTLYNENISVKEMNNDKYAGQPAWYFWMAANKDKFSFPVFPMFDTKDGSFRENVLTENRYLEGRTNIKNEGYAKFTTTAIFTAGMSPEDVTRGIMMFLKNYQPEKYAYMPMLDVMQRMTDCGFNVWIITGSNPYFVASQVRYIEENLNYTADRKYNFNISKAPYDSESGHIAGNGLKLLKDGKFSVVYNDRYVKNPEGKLFIVDEQGKTLVVKNLEKANGSKAIFAAGNSGGDYYDIKYIIANPHALAIAVEPRGTLLDLVAEYPDKIVQLDTGEVLPVH